MAWRKEGDHFAKLFPLLHYLDGVIWVHIPSQAPHLHPVEDEVSLSVLYTRESTARQLRHHLEQLLREMYQPLEHIYVRVSHIGWSVRGAIR